MGHIVPDAVEAYLASLNHLPDNVLQDVAREGQTADLPLVDAEVGALLRLLAMSVRATQILEIGTAIGYSGIWLAGALPPGGRLITMERYEFRARTARANFERAGLADRVSVVVGDARLLINKVAGPFDVVFQDGDKSLYVPMLDRLVDLLRPGGLLITDNVLWDGEVVPGYVREPKRPVADTKAIAEYNERLSRDPRLMTVSIPMRDGIAVALKKTAARQRGLPELEPLLEALARATRALRAANFAGDARPDASQAR